MAKIDPIAEQQHPSRDLPDPEILAVEGLTQAIFALSQAVMVFAEVLSAQPTEQQFWDESYKALLSAGRTPDEAEQMAGEAVHHRAVAWGDDGD